MRGARHEGLEECRELKQRGERDLRFIHELDTGALFAGCHPVGDQRSRPVRQQTDEGAFPGD